MLAKNSIVQFAVVVLGAVAALPALGQAYTSRIGHVGNDHHDTRSSVTVAYQANQEAGLKGLVGLEANLQTFGGFLPSFIWLDTHATAYFMGGAGFGVNAKAKLGLGSRGWRAGPQKITVSTSSSYNYSSGTTTTTEIFFIEPYVPQMREKAYYASAELHYTGAVKGAYSMLVGFGRHLGTSVDSTVEFSLDEGKTWQSRSGGGGSPASASVELTAGVNPTTGTKGIGVTLSLHPRFKWVDFRMDLGANPAIGAFMQINLGANYNMNIRHVPTPMDSFGVD